MTSCYSLTTSEVTEEVTCADGNTYQVADKQDSYHFDSSNPGCNLDEANGENCQEMFKFAIGAVHPATHIS